MEPARQAAPRSPLTRSSRIFGPPKPVVLGTLLASVVFVVVLEFLVIISFIGQRLWRDPRMMHDVLFTLPLIVWVLVLLASITMVARILTTWLRLTGSRFEVHGLFRRTVSVPWEDVGRVVAVHDIARGATAAEVLERSAAPYDGVFVLALDGERLANVSGRFFGVGAQHAVVERARAAGVEIRDIPVITPRELRSQEPSALSVVDRHPNLVLAAIVPFYLAHNILTFAIWGL